MTGHEFDLARKAMADAGRVAGKHAGTWVADGNTSTESLRRMLKMWDDGDPAGPCPPCPWDDENPTNVVMRETEIENPHDLEQSQIDELCMEFEMAYDAAWYEIAVQTVRGLLPDPE